MTKDKVTIILLAGGYATRLYPLTRNIPKPLLYITEDKTVIDLIVNDLEKVAKDIAEIVIVTNSKFYANFVEWADLRIGKIKLSVLDDKTTSNSDRLGAIGDIYFAIKKKNINTDIVVVAGDNIFERGFQRFFKRALACKRSCIGLTDIKDKTKANRFGVVTLGRDNEILALREKPKKPKSSLVATCLYYFPKDTLSLLRKYIENPNTSNDTAGHYISWLLKRKKIYGLTVKGGWHDIGHFDAYKKVIKIYKRRKKKNLTNG